MRVLLEAGGRGEGLAALGAGVAAGADVLRADVALEVGRIGKYLKTSGFEARGKFILFLLYDL